MRFRLLVALPLALLIVGCLFVSASSLLAAALGPAPPGSDCDVLRREIHALSHEVTPCSLSPECQGSPLLCPIALDPRIEREYTLLRDALQTHCEMPSDLLDFAWEAGVQAEVAEGCALAHDGWEAAARGEAAPASYSF